jgi:hypothetical protein
MYVFFLLLLDLNGGIKWGIDKRHTKLLNSSIRIKMRAILLMIGHLALGMGRGRGPFGLLEIMNVMVSPNDFSILVNPNC